MLKLPLFVTLCGSLLINYLPANAHSGGLGASSGAGMSGLAAYMLPSPSRPLRKFVDAYIKENNEELAEIRERSFHPFTIIDSVMDHYDLPEELRYLAVIESELRPGALSRVGAKGPWQLMAGTARELGLKVGRRSDERTNYYKSTGAAALYLRDLHREFNDWLLVLAAYNAGPGPVYRAMKLAGSRNFWALEKYLPGETRRHVRRFIATAYYFAISGPVIDPAGPVGDPSGLAGDPSGLAGGPSVPGVPGLMAAGLSDGVSGGVPLAVEIGTVWRRNEPVM
jgi:membrane-bound lytic murein transglycosylase D